MKNVDEPLVVILYNLREGLQYPSLLAGYSGKPAGFYGGHAKIKTQLNYIL
jgi:hypothetical protein